jgi:von Willebrand factor A domain-containing protein 7
LDWATSRYGIEGSPGKLASEWPGCSWGARWAAIQDGALGGGNNEPKDAQGLRPTVRDHVVDHRRGHTCWLWGARLDLRADESQGLGSNTHESITKASVEALDKEFFSVSKLTRTMNDALDDIVTANENVDHDQFQSALHFDGENFAGGQARLIDLFNSTLADIRAKNARAARGHLGAALHTIQDFYAHSNWVELGNAGPNPDLGRPGHTIGNVAAPNEATCNGSTLITTHLTSGYYGGEDRTPPAGVAKCRHGGPFDRSPGSGGINKDFRLSTLSPHSTFHDAAARAALLATDQFIRDIKEQITTPQLRMLLGAGPVLGMAIDTTGSMGSIIDGVKSRAISIVNARLGTDEEPSSYVLSPFNDPHTGPLTVTDNPDEFKAAIGRLSADGGGTAPSSR